LETANIGADLLAQLAEDCGLVRDLGRYGLTRQDIPRLAESAMTVTRLLKNNPRPLEQTDAEDLYQQCFAK
jgi:alcohol dehydrogenase